MNKNSINYIILKMCESNRWLASFTAGLCVGCVQLQCPSRESLIFFYVHKKVLILFAVCCNCCLVLFLERKSRNNKHESIAFFRTQQLKLDKKQKAKRKKNGRYESCAVNCCCTHIFCVCRFIVKFSPNDTKP